MFTTCYTDLYYKYFGAKSGRLSGLYKFIFASSWSFALANYSMFICNFRLVKKWNIHIFCKFQNFFQNNELILKFELMPGAKSTKLRNFKNSYNKNSSYKRNHLIPHSHTRNVLVFNNLSAETSNILKIKVVMNFWINLFFRYFWFFGLIISDLYFW